MKNCSEFKALRQNNCKSSSNKFKVDASCQTEENNINLLLTSVSILLKSGSRPTALHFLGPVYVTPLKKGRNNHESDTSQLSSLKTFTVIFNNNTLQIYRK